MTLIANRNLYRPIAFLIIGSAIAILLEGPDPTALSSAVSSKLPILLGASFVALATRYPTRPSRMSDTLAFLSMPVYFLHPMVMSISAMRYPEISALSAAVLAVLLSAAIGYVLAERQAARILF